MQQPVYMGGSANFNEQTGQYTNGGQNQPAPQPVPAPQTQLPPFATNGPDGTPINTAAPPIATPIAQPAPVPTQGAPQYPLPISLGNHQFPSIGNFQLPQNWQGQGITSHQTMPQFQFPQHQMPQFQFPQHQMPANFQHPQFPSVSNFHMPLNQSPMDSNQY